MLLSANQLSAFVIENWIEILIVTLIPGPVKFQLVFLELTEALHEFEIFLYYRFGFFFLSENFLAHL